MSYFFAFVSIVAFTLRLVHGQSTAHLTSTTASDASNSSLITHPIPSGVATRDTFTIRVRESGGGEWQRIEAFEVSLAEVNITTGQSALHKTSVASFDADAPVDVSISYNLGNIGSAAIRPLSYGIIPDVKEDSVSFSLDQPRNIVVQVNNDIFDCLHLFTNAIANDAPTSNKTDVIYFGPGHHRVPGGNLNVTSGQTVYIAGGAVIDANINFYKTAGASLRGHGALRGPGGAVNIEWSADVLIEDVMLLGPSHSIQPAVSENVTIRGIRSLSSRAWGDGIDVYCSTNVLIQNIFMRNSDDCIAIYNHRYNYYGDSRNITVEQASLWADLAHPINVGTHGNSDSPETIDGLIFRDIDVLDHREWQVDYQGCLALNAGDSNLITNVLVDGFRIEDIRRGQIINMRVMFNSKYNTSPGRGISGVIIKDMSYIGDSASMSILSGYSPNATIEYVEFQNLTINGQVISDSMPKPGWYMVSDFVPAFADDNVFNLTFVE